MGFYPNMIRPAASGQTRAYTLIVNEYGEVVVCVLDADGKPTGFTTASTGVVLLRSLAGVLIDGKGTYRVDLLDDNRETCYIMLGVDKWSEAAAILNGKVCAKRRTMVERRSLWMDYIDPENGVTRYIKIKNGEHVVTDIGKKLDAMRDGSLVVV